MTPLERLIFGDAWGPTASELLELRENLLRKQRSSTDLENALSQLDRAHLEFENVEDYLNALHDSSSSPSSSLGGLTEEEEQDLEVLSDEEFLEVLRGLVESGNEQLIRRVEIGDYLRDWAEDAGQLPRVEEGNTLQMIILGHIDWGLVARDLNWSGDLEILNISTPSYSVDLYYWGF